MFNYHKLLLLANRIIYISSAALLIAGAVLTVSPRQVTAVAPVDYCSNVSGNQETIPDWVTSSGGVCSCTDSANSFLVSGSQYACFPSTWIKPDGKIDWCHVSESGNEVQLDLPPSSLISAGHVTANGQPLHGGDYQGLCTTPTTDVCPNLEGTQETVPEGMMIDPLNGNCVEIPVIDVCPNLEGDQETLPPGMYIDNNGDCVYPPDVCPNIEDDQETLPEGMFINGDGDCVPDVCLNLEGDQETLPEGMFINGEGDCVPDVCLNIEGDQESPPDGMVVDDQGNCFPPRANFNLTSMCRPDEQTGQMRVRNQSAYEYPYLLYRVGGIESYTGTAPAATDVLVTVPWHASNDTWKLEIANQVFTKAIGNNQWCLDVCPNIDGPQLLLPEDMWLDLEGNCQPDVCVNLDGVQEIVPEGWTLEEGGICVPPPDDVCPNIGGIQEAVPAGLIVNAAGDCVEPPVDVCPNIGGNQATVPAGYELVNGQCVVIPPPPAIGGGGELLIPVTGAGGEILIPVTGADLTPGMNNLTFGGFGMLGLGLIMTGVRRKLEE